MQTSAHGLRCGHDEAEGWPQRLRVVIGTAAGAESDDGAEHVVELQTNLDDVSPEVVGHACRLLREAGALDVWTVPAR